MQGFYFLAKFGLILFYILKVYRKKFSSIYWEKICSIYYLYFSSIFLFLQVLKDSSVEDVATAPSIFHSKFSSGIHLSWIINYWGSIFTLYLTWGGFILVCVLFVFFSFFLSFFFFFNQYFPWQVLTIHRIAGKGEGIIIFLVFHFHPLRNIHLVNLDP